MKKLIILGWVATDPCRALYSKPMAATWSDYSDWEHARAVAYATMNDMTVFTRDDTPDVLEKVRREVELNLMER